LKAPIWLQMVHLLLTSTIWLLVVFFGAALLSDRRAEVAAPQAPYAKARA
jgi:hypothetical protein